jgi:hypothetical protein
MAPSHRDAAQVLRLKGLNKVPQRSRRPLSLPKRPLAQRWNGWAPLPSPLWRPEGRPRRPGLWCWHWRWCVVAIRAWPPSTLQQQLKLWPLAPCPPPYATHAFHRCGSLRWHGLFLHLATMMLVPAVASWGRQRRQELLGGGGSNIRHQLGIWVGEEGRMIDNISGEMSLYDTNYRGPYDKGGARANERAVRATAFLAQKWMHMDRS